MSSRSSLVAALAIAAPLLLADHPVSPEPGFDVLSYDVAVTPDIAAKSVRGTETVRLRVGEGGAAELRFSPNVLAIDGATLNGARVRVSSSEDGIVFTPQTPLPQGAVATLRFRFSGMPKRGLQAVPGGLYSSYSACDWMVCLQDSPGDKARLSLALTVSKGLQVLAPGTLVSREERGGKTIWRWRTVRDYSPYLYDFAVGDFPQRTVERNGAALTYYDGTGEHADLATMFAETPDMIEFLESKAGVALPAGRYAQLLVPGYEAQEAATFSLIGAKALARDLAEPDSEWIVVHELSHQWWGNLVTCATWRDFWLNEGFAVFMTAAWKEQRYGRAAYEAELDVARKRLAKVREAGFDKPLTWDGDYPSLGTRRAVQYSKGALFLDRLRSDLGEDAFWQGIADYTTKHAGGTVTSADFERAMEAASGRDLSALFGEWVFGTGDEAGG